MNVTNRAEKVDGKMGSFDYFSCSLSDLWSLNYFKKSIFYDFVKKSKYIKEIYTLSENGIVYYAIMLLITV